MKWDDLRIFLAIVRSGSFSAAARNLDVNQSTISRRLAALEGDLRTKLFDRSPDGYDLTAAGNDLLVMANNVEEEFLRIDRRVVGRDTRLSGQLRVTCVDMMADRYLAPHFAQFCSMHPEIELRLLTPFQPMDLTRHEAEVAIRVSDNPPETLIGRRLLTFAMGAYAAPHFLDRLPANPDPAEVDWIGWESDSYNRRMISNYFPTAKVFHRVDSFLVLNSLVRAGMGASVFPCYWADTEAGLRRVYRKPISDDTLGLWVLVHPDARRAAKVRAFTDFISNAFQADRDLFEGLRPTSR